MIRRRSAPMARSTCGHPQAASHIRGCCCALASAFRMAFSSSARTPIRAIPALTELVPAVDSISIIGSRTAGPVVTDFTHIANLAGVVQLPWRFELGLNFSFSSVPPFSTYVGGVDFNGDGTQDHLLPGSTLYAFNRGVGRADLERP